MSTAAFLNTATPSATAAQEHATTKATSGLEAAKNLFREAPPFARKSVLLRPRAVPWEVYARKLSRTALVYFPGMMLVLGWPLAAKAIIEYSKGVYEEPGKRRQR